MDVFGQSAYLGSSIYPTGGSVSFPKRRVSVLVTDLDNTLYDWLEQWHAAFEAMIDRVAEKSGVPRETLLDECKAVHERHGTSEYAFLLQELPSLRAKHPADAIIQIYDDAIHAYRSARKATLRLYPKVLETLQAIKERGCIIVAYTESMAFYTNSRVRDLGLDGIIDYLYSPQDHDLPEGLTPEQVRKLPAEHYSFKKTVHRYTPPGELKPNPHILLSIIADVGALRDEAVYVGDKLNKDVHMAQLAGVADVWAKFGDVVSTEKYDLLRRVTHWKAQDVKTEKLTTERDVIPTYVLDSSFSELLALFEFGPDTTKKPDHLIIGWQKSVDVQQHFNDIELKIRSLAITLMGAFFGAAGFIVKEGLELTILGLKLPAAGCLLLTALPVWLAFYMMDRFWYHRLLVGAVKHGIALEKELNRLSIPIALADSIGKESPVTIFRKREFLGFQLGGHEYRSDDKIKAFYRLGTAVIFVLVSLSFLISPVARHPEQQISISLHSNEAVKALTPATAAHQKAGD